MTTAGEARMFLEGKATEDLNQIKTALENLSREDAVRLINLLKSEIYLLRSDLYRNKAISKNILANLQNCCNKLDDLGDKVNKMILSETTAEKQAIQGDLLKKLNAIKKIIDTQRSFLIQLEQEERRKDSSQQASA